MKITVGEAIARWLVAQEIELDNGKIVPYFAGVMSIFGHGNALGFGDALFDLQDRIDRKSTRLNSSHSQQSRMPSSA